MRTSHAHPASRIAPLDARIAVRGMRDVRDRAAANAAAATLRRGTLVVAAYVLLAIFFTWPLTLYLNRGVTSSIDPIDSIWRIGWGQYRLLHNPLHLFQGNTFYPFADTYLFDELVLGSAVMTLPLAMLHVSPLAIYNLAILLTFVLCGATMYALARRFGASPVAAFGAGVIYAFAPMHFDRIGHIGILSIQWYPLILLMLDRVIERPRLWNSVALAACLIMQAISSQYHAIYLAVLVPLFLIVMGIRRPEMRRPRVLLSLVAAGVVALAVLLPIVVGYRRVQTEYGVERSYGQVTYYSATITSFVTADGQNGLWGAATAPLRAQGRYTFERIMFPGVLALLLAAVGLWAGRRRAWEQFLAALVVVAGILALGPELRTTPDSKSLLLDHLPYGILYWHLPGWDGMRAPARFGALFLLGIAGLAATGATTIGARLATLRLPRGMSARAMPIIAGVALLVGFGGEYANHPLNIVPLESGGAIPPVYHWLATQPEATVIELPLIIPDHEREQQIAVREQYYSLVHHHPLVNGNANVLPKGYKALVADLSRVPSPRAVSLLQGLGITHVVVHYDDFASANVGAQYRERLETTGGLTRAAAWGDTVAYRVAPTTQYDELRAAVSPHASVLLSRADPVNTGAYMAMLGYVLRDHPLYANLRVDFGQEYRGPPQPGAIYEYAALFAHEDPATVGFTNAQIVWQDGIVRVYKR